MNFQWDDIKPGEFFAGGPRGTTPETCNLAREILPIKISPDDELCYYRAYNLRTGQPKGIHACSRGHMLEWSRRKPTAEEMHRMTFWSDGLTEEEKRSQQKRALRMLLEEKTFIQRLSKLLVLQGFRNGPLENIHAGVGPSSKTGDFSDVKVVSPYGEIPWNDLSRITQEEMRDMMIRAVNVVFTLLWEMIDGPEGNNLINALIAINAVGHWNEPEIDSGMQKIIREELHDKFVAGMLLNGPVEQMHPSPSRKSKSKYDFAR